MIDTQYGCTIYQALSNNPHLRRDALPKVSVPNDSGTDTVPSHLYKGEGKGGVIYTATNPSSLATNRCISAIAPSVPKLQELSKVPSVPTVPFTVTDPVTDTDTVPAPVTDTDTVPVPETTLCLLLSGAPKNCDSCRLRGTAYAPTHYIPARQLLKTYFNVKQRIKNEHR